MLGWLIRTSLQLFITPTELERARTWMFHTAAGQALTQAHAHGYRQGYIAGVDDTTLDRAKQQ